MQNNEMYPATVLENARRESQEETEMLQRVLSEKDPGSYDSVHKVITAVSFLMDWCSEGLNGNLNGRVSAGLANILWAAAEGAARLAKENDALTRWAYEQSNTLKTKGEPNGRQKSK
jgi:hypothetical protein